MLVEGLCPSRPLQLDGRAVQDTRHLVWSLSPAGEKLVGSTEKSRSRDRCRATLEAFPKESGWGVQLAYLSAGPLSSFSFQSRAPSYSSWKGSCRRYSGLNGLLWCGGITQLHSSEGSLGIPNAETQRHILCFSFLSQMCSQDDETGAFWKEDARLSFPTLRSVHVAHVETHRLPRNECPFYREC